MSGPVFPIQYTGFVSEFGGPHDLGVRSWEGLALVDNIAEAPDVFLPQQPPFTTGLARRLDPTKFYIAMRWPRGFSHAQLRAMVVTVSFGEKVFRAQPVDWGPGLIHRIADLSPGLITALGVDTDKERVVITLNPP